MNESVKTTLSLDEIERRVDEYREKSFERRTMPHILYRPPFIVCPWQGCSYAISGVDFQLELFDDQSLYQRLMEAWWKGAGLAGRCPGCGNFVLFTIDDKQQVNDPAALGLAVLPDDWHLRAYIL
jgi:hypothetical protein